MVNEALRAIIDLLKIKKEAKKTDLEIDKLQREKAKAEAVVEIATLEEIKQYDETTKKRLAVARTLEFKIRELKSKSPLLLIVIGVASLLTFVHLEQPQLVLRLIDLLMDLLWRMVPGK